MPALMSIFGLTNPASGSISDLISSSLLTRFGSFWALTVAMTQLSGVIGSNESAEIKQHRQWLSLITWSAWLIGMGKMCIVEGFEGGIFGCAFNFAWMMAFVFFVTFNLKFVGMGTVFKKLKGE